MKIGMIQLNSKWHDKEANYNRAENLIREASSQNCEIVVLPEMFNTGFSMEIEKIGEDLHGQTSEFLQKAAARYNTAVIAGYPVFDASGKGKNTAIAVDETGKIVATYYKMFLFSYAKEHLYYNSGQSPVVFNIRGVKASVFICYDLRFPQIFSRIARSVQCIFVIANWPVERIDHWNSMLKARAIEDQCYVIGVNRIGTDANGLTYPGNSHVFSPSGVDLCAGNGQDEMVIADIDLNEVDKVRSEYPFLNDMRISDEINGKDK
jgi:predicted amidohydrolase